MSEIRVERVINSCKTFEQLLSAKKYADLFVSKEPNDLFAELMYQKFTKAIWTKIEKIKPIRTNQNGLH